MALIKCPECGKEISDKAAACPNCGCPIKDASLDGIVKIKLGAVKVTNGFNGDQKVSIHSGEKLLWEGKAGEIAEIYFETVTDITVKYHLSLMHYGGECSGTIDPAKSKKYCVSTRVGFMSTKLILQEVDIFDAD